MLPYKFVKSCVANPHAKNALARFVCYTSCAIPTADESNHSAAGTLHPHCNAACSLYTSHCAINPPQKRLPLPIGGYPPHLTKSTSRPTTSNGIIGALFLLLVMYNELAELTVSQSGHPCMRNCYGYCGRLLCLR